MTVGDYKLDRQKHLKDFKYFTNSLAFIYKNNRITFLVSVLFFIISGVIPYLNVTAISYIIQEAEKIAINNMPVFETNVITGIVLLAVFIFIDRFIMLGYMPLFSVMRYRVVSNVNVLIVEKTSRLPYSYIESADFQNKLQAVRNFANNLPDLFDISLSSLRSIITIIALLLKFK